MALPQIEWVNIFIEPANTPLSVIPAEAGIQCLARISHQDQGSRRWIRVRKLWSEKRSHSYGLSEEQACGHEDQPEP